MAEPRHPRPAEEKSVRAVTAAKESAGDPPPPTLGMCGTTLLHERFVVCCGGALHGARTPTGRFWCFDLMRERWIPVLSPAPSKGASATAELVLPFPLLGHSLVSHGNSVWVIGGFVNGTSALRSFLHMQFSFVESSPRDALHLVSLATYPSCPAAMFTATVYLQSPSTHTSLVMALGGLTVDGKGALAYTNRVFSVSLEEVSLRAVRQLGAVPSPRAAAAACVLAPTEDPTIVLYGGRGLSGPLSDLFLGSVRTGDAFGGLDVLWRRISPRSPVDMWPSPRVGACLVMCSGYPVLCGGTVGAAGEVIVVKNQRSYLLSCALSSCTWSELGQIVNRCFFHALTIEKDTILAGGSQAVFLRPVPFDAAVSQAAAAAAKASQSVAVSSCQLRAVLQCPSAAGTALPAIDIKLPPSASQVSFESLKNEIATRLRMACDPDDILLWLGKPEDKQPLHSAATLQKLVTGPERAVEVTVTIHASPRDYLPYELIGRGSFGEVYSALNETDSSLFAVKVVTVDSHAKLDGLRNEIRMMRQLSHPNIVQYLGSQHKDGKMHIFMEFIAGGDTLEKLCRKCALPIRSVQMYTRQLLHALAFLHGQGIVHRDVKGANVLLNTSGVVKLSDFGTAKHFQQSALHQSKSITGTALFMAPEVMRNGPYGAPVDIWSLGCLVIELISGKYPYEEQQFSSVMQIMYHVADKGCLPQFPERMTPNGVKFLKRCLQLDPTRRATAVELLRDPFITDFEAAGGELKTAAGQVEPAVPPRAPAQRLHPPTRPSSTAVKMVAFTKPSKLMKRGPPK